MKPTFLMIGVIGLVLGLIAFGVTGTAPHAHEEDSAQHDCLLCRTPAGGMELAAVAVTVPLPTAQSSIVVPAVAFPPARTILLPSQERAPPAFSSIV